MGTRVSFVPLAEGHGLVDGEPHWYRLFAFPNGYAVSVTLGPATYGHEDGLFELAVRAGSGDGPVVTGTQIADEGILGWLSEDEVQQVLARVGALPNRLREVTDGYE